MNARCQRARLSVGYNLMVVNLSVRNTEGVAPYAGISGQEKE